MDLLSDMALFRRIVDTGSLAGAARAEGLSPAAVSQRLKALETHYGAPLLTRSSRALSLTEEGALFLASARRVLRETESLADDLSHRAGGLAGRLRIAAPSDLGRQVVEPLILEFCQLHPEISIELFIGDAIDDVITGDLDLAFRYGNLSDSGLVARPLATNRRVVVGAPGYLEEFGIPQSPDELGAHRCLVLLRGREPMNRWTFRIDGEDRTVAVAPTLAVNDGEILRRWTVAGHGLAQKSLLDVRGDLVDGNLVEVLADFTPAAVGIQAVFPASRRNTPRVRALVDAALDRFTATHEGDA